MFGLFLWILVFPRIIYHILVILVIAIAIILYMIYKQSKCQPNSILSKYRTMMARRGFYRRLSTSSQISLALILVVSCGIAMGDEQDAKILMPIHRLMKGIIQLIATGKPVKLDFTSRDAAKSLGLLVVRAQFPRKMPADVTTKTQDLLNRLKTRVDESSVDSVTRKTLERLGDDLNDIADALIDQVRNSRDGIYTDYLQTEIDGVQLEDALYNVGLQLKAYHLDLTTYKELVGILLSMPALPAFATSVVGALNQAPNLESLREITKQLAQNPMQPINGLANVAKNAIQWGQSMPNSVMTFGSNVPLSAYNQLVLSPLSGLTGLASRTTAIQGGNLVEPLA